LPLPVMEGDRDVVAVCVGVTVGDGRGDSVCVTEAVVVAVPVIVMEVVPVGLAV
jgi:hypothetical protein